MTGCSACSGGSDALAIKMLDKALEMARYQASPVTDPALAAVAAQSALQIVDVAAGQVDAYA